MNNTVKTNYRICFNIDPPIKYKIFFKSWGANEIFLKFLALYSDKKIFSPKIMNYKVKIKTIRIMSK